MKGSIGVASITCAKPKDPLQLSFIPPKSNTTILCVVSQKLVKSEECGMTHFDLKAD